MSPTLSLTFCGLLQIKYSTPLEVKLNGYLSIPFYILFFHTKEPLKSIIIYMLLSRSPLFLFSNSLSRTVKMLRFDPTCKARS